MFFKTGDLENSAIFTRNPVIESLFNKAALKFFIKKRLQHRYFPVNIFKNSSCYRTSVAAFDVTLAACSITTNLQLRTEIKEKIINKNVSLFYFCS